MISLKFSINSVCFIVICNEAITRGRKKTRRQKEKNIKKK